MWWHYAWCGTMKSPDTSIVCLIFSNHWFVAANCWAFRRFFLNHAKDPFWTRTEITFYRETDGNSRKWELRWIKMQRLDWQVAIYADWQQESKIEKRARSLPAFFIAHVQTNVARNAAANISWLWISIGRLLILIHWLSFNWLINWSKRCDYHLLMTKNLNSAFVKLN